MDKKKLTAKQRPQLTKQRETCRAKTDVGNPGDFEESSLSLSDLQDEQWRKEGTVPAVAYENDHLKHDVLTKRPHEARTAQRLTEHGIRAVFVPDVAYEMDSKTGRLRSIGLPDLAGGIELKTLNAHSSLASIDSLLRNAGHKRGLKLCVIDNYEAKLPDDEVEKTIRQRMAKRGVPQVLIIDSEMNLRMCKKDR